MSFPAIHFRSSPGSRKDRPAPYKSRRRAGARRCLGGELAFPRGYRASAA
jgi:hypothetical protein